MNKLFLFFLCLILTQKAIACSCFYHSRITIQNYNETQAIFIGSFVKAHPLQKNGVVNEFIVTKWYKGEDKKERIFVRDAEDVGACGLGKLITGMEYLVYAREHNNILYTTSCSNTTFVPGKSKSIPDSFWFKGFRFSKTSITTFVADTQFLNIATRLINSGGHQKFKYPNGKLMGEGTLINGKPHGRWKYYYPNGELQQQGNYINGLKDSIWAEYGDVMFGGSDYSLYELVEYKNDEPTFWKITYMGDYPKKYDETYPIKGSDNWIHKIYHSNGKLRISMMHRAIITDKNGRRKLGPLNGPCKSYYETGVLQEEGEHYKGYETGIWKEYNDKGKIKKIRQELTKEQIDLKE